MQAKKERNVLMVVSGCASESGESKQYSFLLLTPSFLTASIDLFGIYF
jgi:hypothetical protein